MYIFVFHPDGKSANHLSNGRRPLASAAGDLEESSWRGGKTYSGSFGQDERCSSWRGGRQQHLWHFLNLFQFFLGCRRRRSSKMCGTWGFGGWGSGQVWQGGFSFPGLKVARLSQSVFKMFPFSFAWRKKVSYLQACGLPGSLQGSLATLLLSDDFVLAVRSNILAGGDCNARFSFNIETELLAACCCGQMIRFRLLPFQSAFDWILPRR